MNYSEFWVNGILDKYKEDGSYRKVKGLKEGKSCGKAMDIFRSSFDTNSLILSYFYLEPYGA